MEHTASLAVDGIPFFINTGTDLLTQYASNLPIDSKTGREIQLALANDLRSVQYFKQLAYVDVNGKIITSYPDGNFSSLNQQQMGIVKQAVEGGILNAYTTYTLPENHQVKVAFAVTVKDQLDRVKGALIGETDIQTNPYTQSLVHLLTTATNGTGNEGYLVDSHGTVIFHPNSDFINSKYPGEITNQKSFFTLTTSSNVQLLMYYYPTKSEEWAVVLAVPAAEIQSTTWRMVLPLFGLYLLMAFIFYLLFKTGLSSMARSIKTLTNEADRIAKGQMENSQYIRGDDEIGQLGSTFEQMRMNVKDRLEEQDLLLSVSQGIAANIDLEPALTPILKAALKNGGAAARIVLTQESEDESVSGSPLTFAAGEMMKYYAYLDDQIVTLTRNRDVVTLNSLARGRVLRLDADRANPSAIISVPIRHKNRVLGILWVAYDAARAFPETEIRFMNTLASDTALAITNYRLIRSAELGAKRLHAILESSSDPILMIDQNDTILLANNPARDLFKGNELFIEGRKVQDVITSTDLIDLLRGKTNNTEIRLNRNRVFSTTISELSNENSTLGKVCILRDVSHYKEEDSRKSEFVANVSHDLRSPLTLMRGNATMIKMVGELNEQQTNYVDKILVGIASMSRMVNNLLDLNRIEEGYGLQLEFVNTGDILNNVLSDLELQVMHKNITIQKHISSEIPPSIQADSALLQQALYNLVENAVKYSPVGGEVMIEILEEDGTVQFEVKDRGRGIAPIDIPQLFEKSNQSTHRDGYAQKSYSMGLSIVKSVAEKHGGKVWVESVLGEGSTFYLQIPKNTTSTVPDGLEPKI